MRFLLYCADPDYTISSFTWNPIINDIENLSIWLWRNPSLQLVSIYRVVSKVGESPPKYISSQSSESRVVRTRADTQYCLLNSSGNTFFCIIFLKQHLIFFFIIFQYSNLKFGSALC